MSSLAQRLRSLAGQRDPDASNFFLERGGLRISIACESSVVFRASYDSVASHVALRGYRDAARGVRASRPMNITLESIRGTITFYARAADHVVQAVLQPDLRRCAQALFELGTERIVIDDDSGRVVVTIEKLARTRGAEELVDALDAFLRALPPISSE